MTPTTKKSGIEAELERRGNSPQLAELIRRVLAKFENTEPLNLWLPFPQTHSCFAFGSDKVPLPVGALLRLWSIGTPFIRPCPACEGSARIYDFGGLLAVGGAFYVCLACEAHWIAYMGGMPFFLQLVKPHLEGTEFAITHTVFGGTIPSDGAELKKALGMAVPQESTADPAPACYLTLRGGNQKARFHLG